MAAGVLSSFDLHPAPWAPPGWIGCVRLMSEDQITVAETTLGYSFDDPALLVEALTHASIADARVYSNERLEFLGDAVLGMVVCEYLFKNFPDLLEGDMTKIKSVAVSRRTCAKIARELGLLEQLRLGKGMQMQNTLPSSLAAAVVESVVGAIYLDSGYEAAREFLLEHLEPIITAAAESGHQQNFKSVLQHIAQDRFGDTPSYVLLDEKGPDHAKCFEVCVQINAQRYESSWGQSKKQAEQQAALNALEALGVIVTNDAGELLVIQPDDAEIEEADDPEIIA